MDTNHAFPGVDPDVLAEVVQGYLEAAAWADAPEGSLARFPKRSKALAADTCGKFILACGPLFQQAVEDEGYPLEQFGHDFWLSRRGHGTGFWDRKDLEVPVAGTPPLATDRNGKHYALDSELGQALHNVAYGTNAAISKFAYPDLEAYRGWLYFH